MRRQPTSPNTGAGRTLRRVAPALIGIAVLAGCSSSDADDDAIASTTVVAEAIDTAQDVPASGEVFTDPQGAYRMTVPASWEANHGVVVAEIELWMVDEPRDNFAPNVNVLTQPSPDLDLQEYLDLSVENAPSIESDFEISEAAIIEGTEGQPLAKMAYRSGDLRYLAIIAMSSDGEAVVATLTAPGDRYDTIQDAVLPYLLTLQAD